MPNYQNGKIYTIRSHQTEDIYIGSTIQPLTKRLSTHKAKYKRYKNDKCSYTSSYEIVQYEDVYIELYELYPCNSKEELLRREGELIREMDCVNKIVPGRKRKEYYNENKEQIKKYKKDYYTENKEEICKKKKEYYNENKEQINKQKKKYRDENKKKINEYQKEYYNENKEKYNEYNKQYYQNNKQKTLEKQKQYYQNNKQKITCECGSIVLKKSLKNHKKSIKHINYENSKS